jgi:hypothetical protein
LLGLRGRDSISEAAFDKLLILTDPYTRRVFPGRRALALLNTRRGLNLGAQAARGDATRAIRDNNQHEQTRHQHCYTTRHSTAVCWPQSLEDAKMKRYEEIKWVEEIEEKMKIKLVEDHLYLLCFDRPAPPRPPRAPATMERKKKRRGSPCRADLPVARASSALKGNC